MYYFEVLVVRGNGQPTAGRRVRLAPSSLLGGMSDDVRTDSDGRALLSLASASRATVYIDGRDVGEMRAGKAMFTV